MIKILVREYLNPERASIWWMQISIFNMQLLKLPQNFGVVDTEGALKNGHSVVADE